MDDIFKFPKHIRFPNMVVKQVFQKKKIKFDPEGSNIKVWIRISSLFSQGVTCINVILWFHKCRSSFLPWGSLGNFKHGSAVRGYKFKSACLVNGVQKKKKSREKQACNHLWLFLSLVSKFWEVRMKASESSSHGILGSCSSSWSLFLLTYCKSEDVKCEATGIYFYLNNQWRRWTPCRIIRPKVYLLCAILGGIACNSRIVDEVENFKWTFFF